MSNEIDAEKQVERLLGLHCEESYFEGTASVHEDIQGTPVEKDYWSTMKEKHHTKHQGIESQILAIVRDLEARSHD